MASRTLRARLYLIHCRGALQGLVGALEWSCRMVGKRVAYIYQYIGIFTGGIDRNDYVVLSRGGGAPPLRDVTIPYSTPPNMVGI